DYNRVVLEKLPGQPDSDYINASYVDVMCVQYWPAAKGHEEVYGGIGVTVVHEEQLANFLIRTIRLRKDNSVTGPRFGGLGIGEAKNCPGWRLDRPALDNLRERVMKQFHFTEWTCHSCPFPSALLEYRRRIRHYVKFLGVSQAGTGEGNTGPGAANNRKPSVASAAGSPEHNSLLKPGTAASGSSLQLAQSSQKSGSTQNLLPPPNASGRRLSSVAASQVYVPGPAEELTGPLIVHCNDGAGRSGVFLAIDANLCLSEEDGVFCIYPYLKKMKMARKGLVESMDQYKFIYDALEESVICKKTWFPVCELSQRLKTMSMRDPRSKMNEYQEQFLRISKLAAKFSIGDCAGGHRPENREKNRDVIIVPRLYAAARVHCNGVADRVDGGRFLVARVRIDQRIITGLTSRHSKETLAPITSTQSSSTPASTCSTKEPPLWCSAILKCPRYVKSYPSSRQSGLLYENNPREVMMCPHVNATLDISRGYTRPKEYVVTEWPVKENVVPDFWSLVYDHDCPAIVVLCTPERSPDENFNYGEDDDVDDVPVQGLAFFRTNRMGKLFWCRPYSNVIWSAVESRYVLQALFESLLYQISREYSHWCRKSSRSRKYGNVFTLDMISKQDYPNIRSWIFRINKKIVSLTELMAGVKAEPKTCQLFQLTCWPEGHKVPLSTNSLVELMNMVERWRAKTDYGPVVVVSHDGCARCGVYCAANACIEQVIQHGEVDVFQAVKTVRRHRPHLVQNMTEYKYCYDLVLHYVLHYLHRT
ncbi:unnamed protein product, partial [Notodromas monacha]